MAKNNDLLKGSRLNGSARALPRSKQASGTIHSKFFLCYPWNSLRLTLHLSLGLLLISLVACGDDNTATTLPAATAPALPVTFSPTSAKTTPTQVAPTQTPTVALTPYTTSLPTEVTPPGITAVPSPTAANTAIPAPTSKSPTPAKAQAKGFVNGRVIATPSCPPQISNNPCLPLAIAGRAVYIKDESGGKTLQTLTTDSQGNFQIELAPGKYRVEVLLKGEGDPSAPHLLNITSGQTSKIVIELDTGIR